MNLFMLNARRFATFRFEEMTKALLSSLCVYCRAASDKHKYMKRMALLVGVQLLLFSACVAEAATLPNPTGQANIQQFIATALKAIVQISLPIITFFVVYAGFLFVSARGNPNQLEKAKGNIPYVLIGAALILGAWVLATLLGNTVQQITG